MRGVEVEVRGGWSWVSCKSQDEIDAHLSQSRAEAAVACRALADEIEPLEPQRAQRLRTVANDPNATRDQRWGAFKNDDRAPRESQVEPEGTRIR